MTKSAAIDYDHDGQACEGFAVWDDAGAKRPGILVFPEWNGVGEYTEKRAKMLGELGFNAFVVDVYGKGIRPNTPETCTAEMMKYATNRPLLRGRARARSSGRLVAYFIISAWQVSGVFGRMPLP